MEFIDKRDFPLPWTRNLLWLAIILLLGFTLLPAQAGQNPIVLENSNPGTTEWRLARWSSDTEMEIKGFASATSVNKGETITFYVTVNPAQSYDIKVFRMGWYGGAGGRLMHESGTLEGFRQAEPVVHADTGLQYFPWEPSYSLTIPENWTSGIYLAKLTNAEGFDNYIIFAVRDDERISDFIYQQPVTTYQSYNSFPTGLGKSLYAFNSYGPDTITGTPRAVKVSFDRPYWGSGAGDFLTWELDLVMWLERNGYDVTYATDIDLHQQGFRLLESHRALLSAGHDEYWSKTMYDAAEMARDNGIHLAFFGANAVYWQMRLEQSPDGVPDRIMVVYKDADLDPETDPELKTLRWRDLGRAEQTLVGVQFIADGEFSSDGSTNADYVVINSDHWVYSGSGLTDGDHIPGLVGYEADSLFPDYPSPVSDNHTLLSASPFVAYDGRQVTANSSIYQAPSGAWVFASGTMSWSWGLNREGLISPAIQTTTANVLNRFLDSEGNGGEICSVYVADPLSEASDDFDDADDHHGWHTWKNWFWRSSRHHGGGHRSRSTFRIDSTLEIDDWGRITDINVVDLSGSGFDAIRNIKVTLVSPDSTKLLLAGSCSNVSAFHLSLDDEAEQRLGSRNRPDCLPDDGSTYTPKRSLARLIDEQSGGTWTLEITGNYKRHHRRGAARLDGWGLEICRTED